jgi:hypothetical protein
VNWASKTFDMDIVNAPAKQKGEEEGGEDESEEGESSKCVRYSMTLQYIDTLLDYMGQRGFEYSGITATRRSLKQFTKTSNHYKLFLKINVSS